MSKSRKHHYLSQFYLRNFCGDGEYFDKLHVFDVQSGEWFATSPKNVGAKRDFNRVDIENVEIDALENSLAKFEAGAALALQRIVSTSQFPTDKDLNWMLNLIGIYACRNPRMRSSFNRAVKQNVRIMGEYLVSSEQIFKRQMELAISSGEVKPNNVSYVEMKEFVESGAYCVEIPTDENHRVEFNAFDTVLPLLGQRSWSLLVVESSASDVISCDHPVIITSKTSREMVVGIGTKDTEIIFPISKKLILYGVFERPIKKEVTINSERVAIFNRRIAAQAKRHIYSSRPCFAMR